MSKKWPSFIFKKAFEFRFKTMEEIDVPSHFLCPISLQIMRDPVTISTGITYDRESIEKWLSSCKLKQICPVTNQLLLSDSDPTPNHTLRRLIQAWCTLNASYGIERIPTPKPQIDRTHVLKIFNEAKKFPDSKIKCLHKLKSLLSESERNKTYLQNGEALDFLASMLKNEDETIVEEAVEVIFNINHSEKLFKELLNKNSEIVENLVLILKVGKFQSRAYAITILKSIFKVADPIQKANAKDDLFCEITRLINDQISQLATKFALKTLFSLCPWGRNRIKAIKSGVVFVLVELLNRNSLEGRDECELALVVLDQLCDCAEGRAEFLENGVGLVVLSKRILRVSHLANDKAVRIMYSICKYSATSWVLHEMVQVGLVSKLCLMLQVGANSKTKDRIKDILKLHKSVWKNSISIPTLLSSYPP